MNVNKKYECSMCDYSASYKSHLSRHSRMHTGERPFACQFPGCTRTFKSQSHLVRHVCIHTGQKSFSCPHKGCTASFITNWDLKNHVSIHSGEKLFTCNFCLKRFRLRWTLEVHMRRHTKEKPYKCQVKECPYSTAHQSLLDAHKRKHSGEKFKCPVQNCSFSTVYKLSLKKHRIRHSQEKPFKCNFESCRHAGGTSPQLRKHLRRHCSDKNNALRFRPINSSTHFEATESFTIAFNSTNCSNILNTLQKPCRIYNLTEDPKLRAPAFVVLIDVVRSNAGKIKQIPLAGKISATDIAGGKVKSENVEPEDHYDELVKYVIDEVAEVIPVKPTESKKRHRNTHEEKEEGEKLTKCVLNVPKLIHETLEETRSNKRSRPSNVQQLEAEKMITASPKPLSENLKDQKQDVDSVERRRVFKFYTVVFCPVVLSQSCVPKVKFFCHLCSKQFDKEMQVLTHLRQHTGHDLL